MVSPILCAVLFLTSLASVLGFELTENSLQPNDQFGFNAFVSGNMVAVAAPYYQSGAGAVFLYTCTPSSCQHFQTIHDLQGIPNSNFGINLGFRGNKLVIGSDNAGQGAFWVFQCDPATPWCTQFSGMPITEPNYPNGGLSAWPTIRGDLVAVGAPTLMNSDGAIFFYNCPASTMSCTPFANNPVVEGPANQGIRVGVTFEISGGLLVVSTSRSNNRTGSFYAFQCSTSNPVSGSCTPFSNNPYSPMGVQVGDNFANFLSISGSSMVIVGAASYTNTGSGKVYGYTCKNMDCQEVTSITSPNPEPQEQFGDFITVGNGMFITGAQAKNGGRGMGYAYKITSDNKFVLVSSFADGNGVAGDQLGWSGDFLGTEHVIYSSPFPHGSRGNALIFPIHPPTDITLGVRWGTVGKVYATFRGTLSSKTVLLSGTGIPQGFHTFTVQNLRVGDIQQVDIGTYSRDKLYLVSATIERNHVMKTGTLMTHPASTKGALVSFSMDF